jgi:apolipoprotein D and lipocalin family protein
LPNRFEDGKGKECVGVTATYTLRDDGRIRVVNRCRKQDGKITVAEGVARVKDKRTNARLEVNFAPAFLGFLPFVWGDYNIIELAPDYSFAVVGNPDRKFLWILSRKPQLDEAIYKQVVERAAAQGFDVSRLVRNQASLNALTP